MDIPRLLDGCDADPDRPPMQHVTSHRPRPLDQRPREGGHMRGEPSDLRLHRGRGLARLVRGGLELAAQRGHVGAQHLAVAHDPAAVDHDVGDSGAVLAVHDLVHCVVERQIVETREVEADQVGRIARLEAADAVLQAHHPRAAARRHVEHLAARQPALVRIAERTRAH
jgi:hypothetical protein